MPGKREYVKKVQTFWLKAAEDVIVNAIFHPMLKTYVADMPDTQPFAPLAANG